MLDAQSTPKFTIMITTLLSLSYNICFFVDYVKLSQYFKGSFFNV